MGTTNLSQWYRSVRIPNTFGSVCMSFCENISGIVGGIVDNGKGISVQWSSEVDIAAADRKNNRLIVNPAFVNSGSENAEFREKIAGRSISTEEAIVVVMGIVVHEMMHFKVSPPFLENLVPACRAKNNFALTIANVIEDIYIEALAISMYPNIAWVIADTWNTVFGKSLIEDASSKWDGEKPTNKDEAKAAIRVLVSWKNQNYPFTLRTDFEVALFEKAMSVVTAHATDERIQISSDVFEMLFDFPSVEDEDDAGEQYEADPLVSSQTEDEVKEVIKKLVVLKSHKDIVNAKTPVEQIEDGDGGGYTVFVRKITCGSSVVFTDKPEWQAIGKLHEAIAAQRLIVGQAKSSGRRMGRLDNLFVSPNSAAYGKIFNDSKVEAEYGRGGEGKPQVLFLLDCSGSMKNNKKAFNTFEMAYNATKGLAKHGVPFAVYGFTTEDDALGIEQVSILQLKDWRDSATKGMAMISSGLNSIEFDMTSADAAILWAGKQFPNRNGTKIIIVISDGETSWRMTDGYNAPSKTADAVARVRKTGVQVFGVSIDDRAVWYNEQIYGLSYHVASNDPNAAAKIVRKIVS